MIRTRGAQQVSNGRSVWDTLCDTTPLIVTVLLMSVNYYASRKSVYLWRSGGQGCNLINCIQNRRANLVVRIVNLTLNLTSGSTSNSVARQFTLLRNSRHPFTVGPLSV
jgi:hypothetical protein